MNKRPAFMFYPADWRKDPALRVCSIAARGLWIDLMALMHEGDPYGHLVINGEPVSDAQLARLVGESVAVVRRLLAELEAHNVFSRTEVGIIHSRRMVADEHLREVRAASGKLGGNPSLMDKGKRRGKDNGLDKQTDKQKPTPSVAVAVSGSVANAEGQEPSPRTAAAGKRGPTWLTPYADAWTARYGGKPHFGPLASALKPLHDQHGEAETVRRWSNYLAQTEGKYAVASKFAATWGEWDSAAPKANGRGNPGAQMVANILGGGR